MCKQSFAWWSFTENRAEDPALLLVAAEIGYRGVDFLPAELWPVARDCGLELVIADGHESLEVGFNNRDNHAALSDEVRRALDTAVSQGIRALAVNAGNRVGTSDAEAAAICAEGLAPLAVEAAQAGVELLLEPLNSKIDHIGNQCDHTAWAADVIDRVGLPSLRILYDVYHMQIMEGDLLRTIAEHRERITHFHTAGVPGRGEIDEHQEINYAAVAALLRDQGYDGFVAHEFIPRGDVKAALQAAYDIFAPRG